MDGNFDYGPPGVARLFSIARLRAPRYRGPSTETALGLILGVRMKLSKGRFCQDSKFCDRRRAGLSRVQKVLHVSTNTTAPVGFPHETDVVGLSQLDPAKARAARQLTEEQWESGERPTKEMIHDRRRSHLDVFLICAAHRANMETIRQASPGLDLGLCEEDVKILDDLLRDAAADARSL